jgi:hypothetical protein
MDKKRSFHFSPWLFMLAIVFFYAITRILAGIQVKHEPVSATKASAHPLFLRNGGPIAFTEYYSAGWRVALELTHLPVFR